MNAIVHFLFLYIFFVSVAMECIVFSYRGLAKILGRGLTVQEAINIAFGEDEAINSSVEAVYIAPPDPAVLTDEDSGDEDEGGDFDHLSRRQLLADAEVRTTGGDVLGEVEPTEQTEVDNGGVSTTDGISPIEPAHMLYPKVSDHRDWISGDFTYIEKEFPSADYSVFENKSVVDIFELFIDDEIILFLVEETNQYALFKNLPDPKVSLEEMNCFLAILILSGYNELPSKRMYWEQNLDTRKELVYNAIRRNRFEQILRFLHLASNEKIVRLISFGK